MEKTILGWTSKVQYKKGTPYISLIKHLRDSLIKGEEIECKLIVDGEKLKVVIELR